MIRRVMTDPMPRSACPLVPNLIYNLLSPGAQPAPLFLPDGVRPSLIKEGGEGPPKKKLKVFPIEPRAAF
jgi:hypothetical protein